MERRRKRARSIEVLVVFLIAFIYCQKKQFYQNMLGLSHLMPQETSHSARPVVHPAQGSFSDSGSRVVILRKVKRPLPAVGPLPCYCPRLQDCFVCQGVHPCLGLFFIWLWTSGQQFVSSLSEPASATCFDSKHQNFAPCHLRKCFLNLF